MLQKNIALWLSRKLYIADLSYYKRFSSPCASWLLEEAYTCMGKFMKYCETAGLRKESVLQRKSVSKGRPAATSPTLTLPRKHFECYKAQPFPAPYEKITTVPKVVKKKSQKVMAFAVWP